jgi:hypothetical protein
LSKPDEVHRVAERVGQEERLPQRAERRNEEEEQQDRELRQQQQHGQARVLEVRALQSCFGLGHACSVRFDGGPLQ